MELSRSRFDAQTGNPGHRRLSFIEGNEFLAAQVRCHCNMEQIGAAAAELYIYTLLDKPCEGWHLLLVASDKQDQLRALLRSYGSCLVAYSGGVDSVLLARVAHEVLGEKSLAAIADSPSLPRRELEDALAIAKQFHFPVRVIQTQEFDNPEYLANPNNRCYFCKHELFTQLAPLARAEGFAVVAYGENASDIGDYRPGAQAAAEFQVRAPLKEAG